MYKSNIGRTLAFLIILAYALPALSFSLPAVPTGDSGGCHGHHGPMSMPVPTHSCCYARPLAPAQVQINSILANTHSIVTTAVPLTVHLANPRRMDFWERDFSPPPQSVLRI